MGTRRRSASWRDGSPRRMQQIATENSLSETAFVVKEGDRYHIRWFTPGTEVDLCGHATLASAFVLTRFFDTQAEELTFISDKLMYNGLSGFITTMPHPGGHT